MSPEVFQYPLATVTQGVQVTLAHNQRVLAALSDILVLLKVVDTLWRIFLVLSLLFNTL
jgi:hypothetical protein